MSAPKLVAVTLNLTPEEFNLVAVALDARIQLAKAFAAVPDADTVYWVTECDKAISLRQKLRSFA